MILSDEEIKESHAPYAVFRDSHLEANDRIRELEAIAEWHDILVNSDSYFRDRADRLAVIADALATELEAHRPKPCSYWDDVERYYDENNYDADGVYLPSPGDE